MLFILMNIFSIIHNLFPDKASCPLIKWKFFDTKYSKIYDFGPLLSHYRPVSMFRSSWPMVTLRISSWHSRPSSFPSFPTVPHRSPPLLQGRWGAVGNGGEWWGTVRNGEERECHDDGLYVTLTKKWEWSGNW